ncbi:hypothetical protein K8W59_03420 [Nocardioides rotundus]|uniref:hypothetical protein n=1 Tax=Nocardioides rotundus TaxID=1774216 RepID=UPI001CBF5DC0|nr:hypothetical protein [Nocardioides rotundus]UAL30584.1 hypothetical protein K8W59_03420 [Nocardioides rotundus]
MATLLMVVSAPLALAADSTVARLASFDGSTAGWKVAERSTRLAHAAGSGSGAARVYKVRQGLRATLTQRTGNEVILRRGETAFVQTSVQTSRARTVILWVTQRSASGKVLRAQSVRRDLRGGTWATMSLKTPSAGDGSRLRVSIVAPRLRRATMKVDYVKVAVETPAPVQPAPVQPAPTQPAPAQPAPVQTCVNDPMGIPSSGSYAGATVSGTSSLSGREAQFGTTLPIRRDYFGPGDIDKAVSKVRADHAAKRLPWISFKLPGTWKQMADGEYDAWVRELTAKLAATDGPVWVAFHHEPENDSQPVAEWTRMQARLSKIVHAGSDNVAFTIILMGWHQAYGTDPRLKLDALWPGDGTVDVLGLDPYNWYGHVRSDGARISDRSDLTKYWNVFSSFAKAHGTRWGVAEIAYNDSAAELDPAWISRAYSQMTAAGGVAMSYFDTSYNTLGNTWVLDLAIKRQEVAKNIAQSRRIC